MSEPSSCNNKSSTSASNADVKPKLRPDRLKKGKLQTRPKEHEPDVARKPPDATIVVDGTKYQVRKKGKAKPTTEDGLYHNKNKPDASRKKLEKALLAWAVLMLLHITSAENVTQWNLAVEVADEGTIQKFLSRVNQSRSLHGIWPDKICHGIPRPIATDMQLKQIKNMRDANPKNNFTCCKLQRHEWNKHGWCNWNTVMEWVKLMNTTQAKLDNETMSQECAVICLHKNNTNYVMQARNQPSLLTGCKKNATYSFAGTEHHSPCRFNYTAEDVYEMMQHENCLSKENKYEEAIIDGTMEIVEQMRGIGYSFGDWLGNKSKKLKSFFAEATPYCQIDSIIGNYVYTKNCTPVGLPDTAAIIAPGVFDLDYKGDQILPELTNAYSDLYLLGLVVLSEFCPEMASLIYLSMHYTRVEFHHPLINSTGLDLNQLNLTRGKKVESVVPYSVYVAGTWSCVKPGWWPYSAEVVQVFNGIMEVGEIVLRFLENLFKLWSEATAVGFLVFLIKIINGQPVKAVLWLMLISGTQAKIECRPNFDYAFSFEGPESIKNYITYPKLMTPWVPGVEGRIIETPFLKVRCRAGEWRTIARCSIQPYMYFLAIAKPRFGRPLPTAIIFTKVGRGDETSTYLKKEQRTAICPCKMKPLLKKDHWLRIHVSGEAFGMICPWGFNGYITCAAGEFRYRYWTPGPLGREPNCEYTKVEGGILYNCKKGGNESCQIGDPVKGNPEDLANLTCLWCSKYYSSMEPLSFPRGFCHKGDYIHRDFGSHGCIVNQTLVGGGTVECTIGNNTVKVLPLNKTLQPMPCNPIMQSSLGPPTRTKCTYKYSAVAENRYYNKRDSFWQQYIIKNGWQYWFDLEASDHMGAQISKYLPIVVVALLGGRYVLWALVTYLVLTEYQVTAFGLTQEEAILMGDLLVNSGWVEVIYFVFLLVVVRSQARAIIVYVYYVIVGRPVMSISIMLIYSFKMVSARDLVGIEIFEVNIAPYLVLCYLIFYVVLYKKYSMICIFVVYLAIASVKCYKVALADYIIVILLLFKLLCFVSGRQRFTRLVYYSKLVSVFLIFFLVRLVVQLREYKIGVWVFIQYIDIHFIVVVYVITLVISLVFQIQLFEPLLMVGPALFGMLSMLGNSIILILAYPWYGWVKAIYVRDKWMSNELNKKLKLNRAKNTNRIDAANRQLWPNEGELLLHDDPEVDLPWQVYSDCELPDREGFFLSPATPFTEPSCLKEVIRAVFLAALSNFFQPLFLLETLMHAMTLTSKKIFKELAENSTRVNEIVAGALTFWWQTRDQATTKLEKMNILTASMREIIQKHKVSNSRMVDWFEESDIYGMPKISWVIRVTSFLKTNKAIFCNTCEAPGFLFPKSCPECGVERQRFICGTPLREFEEKYYRGIYSFDQHDNLCPGWEENLENPIRNEHSKDLYYNTCCLDEESGCYCSTGSHTVQSIMGPLVQFLRELPILATKENMLLVGNVGAEIKELEQMGWVLRGPAVCKKIVDHQKTRASIPDKLSAFFGVMPSGATPRAPTRFPAALMKIKRGLEIGWAYSHNGGISSVEHVTAGKDLYCSDRVGRNFIMCQQTNKLTDEVEYGVKTDSGTADGARCYAFNPEATNISGTTGAMVHLKKVGPEFICVTAQGTPAFYNLQNLKGWSGLPIFEAASGRVVGRIKAGKNQESGPTSLLTGTQTVKPLECDLDAVVEKLEKMNRGDFKQVVLATGAGKTTELPRRLIERVGRHKRILVLIPLRAAAEGVYKYMRTKYPSINFNLRIGEHKEGDTQTGITYASYGFFCQMDMPRLREVCNNYNWIFMDEYHCATAEQLAVMSKLHLHAEKIRAVAMTATPAGTVSSVGQRHKIEEMVAPKVLKDENLGNDFLNIAGLKIAKVELQQNTLIFVPTRKMAEDEAKQLQSQGYNAAFFYSGEDPNTLRAVTSKSPYVIVATNAIESGVTLPDLNTVIDTCLKCEKRVAISSSPPFINTSLTTLSVTPGEQAQRRGRVGRTAPGRYVRAQVPVTGQVDYHYNLLQAQYYGLEDGINISKAFREMNASWALYEEDVLLLQQMEILNNLLMMNPIPIATKNILARTTHPEKIQLAYNCIETPMPVMFPKIVKGEVKETYENYNYINCRKLGVDVPPYIYATVEESMVVDLLNLEWPDPGHADVVAIRQALTQVAGLSKAEIGLLVALFGWVGYKALVKRHVPVITDIYVIEEETLEDTTHLQFCPDEIKIEKDEVVEELSNNELFSTCQKYIGGAIDFIQCQAEKIKDSAILKKQLEAAPSFIERLKEYLYENEEDIVRYGLWGVHSALYNSIAARLGGETAFATMLIKWMAFSGSSVPDLVKQAATDVVVYYCLNPQQYLGDEETTRKGRRFVATTFAACLATYAYKNYSTIDPSNFLEPLLSYLPYASTALKFFIPTNLESTVILSVTIYRVYLSIKRGESQGLIGLTLSSAMELVSQNPVTIAISVLLGVGAIAAHAALEGSEVKRTLLMKLFVKNFIDQAATDELAKEDPEKIIMALFEAVQTVGNPLRLVYHLYSVFYKKKSLATIAQEVAGRNILVLMLFELAELLEIDKATDFRKLSSNYLVDLIEKLICKFKQSVKSTIRQAITSMFPAPFSCTTSSYDSRVKVNIKECDKYKIKCACGYTRECMRGDGGKWFVLTESGSNWCRNSGEKSEENPLVTTAYKDNQEMKPLVTMKGEMIFKVGTTLILVDLDSNKLLGTNEYKFHRKKIMKYRSNHDGVKIGNVNLGNEVISESVVMRKEATILASGEISFIKESKGVAYTTDLSLINLTDLLENCAKQKLKETSIPTVTKMNWLSIPLLDMRTGCVKPRFGEAVHPEGQIDAKTDVYVDTRNNQINNQTEKGETQDIIYNVSTTHQLAAKVVEIGFSRDQYPGEKPASVGLNSYLREVVPDNRPTFCLMGRPESMSLKVRASKKFHHFHPLHCEALREAVNSGGLYLIGSGKMDWAYQQQMHYHANFLTTFHIDELLQNLPTKKITITYNEAKELWDLHYGKLEEIDLPNWWSVERPIFADVTESGVLVHYLGEEDLIKEQLKDKGIKKMTHKVGGRIYQANLSSWWEYNKIQNMTPLFEELIYECPPDQEQHKNLHKVTASMLAKGGWEPLYAATDLGRIPARRVKISPYDAYVKLKALLEEKRSENMKYPVSNKHNWIADKIVKNSELGLKYLPALGSVGKKKLSDKEKFNIYNKKISTILMSAGVKLEKLPVVRAQTDANSFHQAIRDKIDKLPNAQRPNLHEELWEVFNHCKVEKLANTYDEVSWDTLENGINRKGAPGFFELDNIGDHLNKNKKKIEKLIGQIKEGKAPFYYETAIPKNEKRAVADDWLEGDYVTEKKPRVIQYPEAKMRLAITKVMYKWVKQTPVVIPGYEGKTPIFEVFNKVKKDWDHFHDPVAISFDTKAWDTQVTPRDLHLIARIQKYYFKKKWHKFIDTITEEMKEVLVVCETGETYIRIGQRGSGQPDTSAGNSMLNTLTMIWAFCKANDIPFKAFKNVARIHVCGDDGFLITHSTLGEKFRQLGPEILKEAGKPQKILEGGLMKLARQFEAIEFCSHTPIDVRWKDGTTSYMPGRDTATILSKMATRLDSSGERGTEAYENAVAFSFLLMYSWNPLIRRVCLMVLSTKDVVPSKSTTYYYEGDPIGAYSTVIGHELSDLKDTNYKKLAELNLSMSLLGIWTKHTTKRILEDSIKLAREGATVMTADYLIGKRVGSYYRAKQGQVKLGKHYEQLVIPVKGKSILPESFHRYNLGPIRFLFKKIRLLLMI
ncbi:polyprotein [Jingmen Crocidura shantungensis pestivirus 1]|nr:polyprotein [Jingmen Crocidura shantungensis pestivirus 1]